MIMSTTNVHDVERVTVQRTTYQGFDTIEITMMTKAGVVEVTAFLTAPATPIETLPDRMVDK